MHASLFVAYTLVGILAAIALFSYAHLQLKLEAVRESIPSRGSMTIRLTSYNIDSRILQGDVVDGLLPEGTPIAFQITDGTLISARTPRITNGVVTGISSAVPAVLEDLAPDTIASVFFAITTDNKLTARSVLVGDPLARYDAVR